MKKKSNISPDLIKVQHMVDAIQEIKSFLKGKSKKNFLKDRMLALSIVKCFVFLDFLSYPTYFIT